MKFRSLQTLKKIVCMQGSIELFGKNMEDLPYYKKAEEL